MRPSLQPRFGRRSSHPRRTEPLAPTGSKASSSGHAGTSSKTISQRSSTSSTSSRGTILRKSTPPSSLSYRRRTRPLKSRIRPISPIHSVAKLIFKVLSTRLAGAPGGFISLAHTTFQKGKCIHNSYQYVHIFLKRLSRKKN